VDAEWWETLEGIARWFLEEACLTEPPVRPRALTVAWGRRLMPARARVHLASTDEIVFYDPAAPPHRRAGDTFHELGHIAMREAGFNAGADEERFAGYLAGALACPRRAFIGDLKRVRWDLQQLVERYEVSWEIIARRVADVRSAAVTVVDNLDEVKRFVSPWIHGRVAREVTPFELELARATAMNNGHLYESNLMTGYAIPQSDTPWMRVITVCGVEELEARMLKRAAPPLQAGLRLVVNDDD